jgi:small subunit ribosomal protein S10e
MQSLKSRGYVREDFSWQWFYYYLTNEGISFLREELHLSEDVVPATLKKLKNPPKLPIARERSERGDRGEGYRRRPFSSDEKKVGGAPGEGFTPSYVWKRISFSFFLYLFIFLNHMSYLLPFFFFSKL